MNYNRRQILGAAAAALAVPARALAAKQDLEIQIAPVSAHTFRLTAFPARYLILTDDGNIILGLARGHAGSTADARTEIDRHAPLVAVVWMDREHLIGQ